MNNNLDAFGLPTAGNEDVGAFDAFGLPVASPLTAKQDRLQERLQNKQLKFKPEILNRMTDADTYSFEGIDSNVRSSTFNAYETYHGPEWEASEYAQRTMPKQRVQLALELGVEPSQVTNEMVYQKGKQQSLEALAAATGSPDWKAGPVSLDPAEQPELGSTAHPMNIEVNASLDLNTNPLDKRPQNNYGRSLGSVQGIQQNVSPVDTPNDPQTLIESQMDNFYNSIRNDESNTSGSYIGNLGKGAASGAINLAAGIADAFVEGGSYIGEKTGDLLGVEFDTEKAKYYEDYMDKFKETKWADNVTGYDREPSEKLIEGSLKSFKNGDIWDGLIQAGEAGPDVFMQSLPYMAAIMTGVGAVSVIGSEFNDSVTAYVKNNEGKQPEGTDLARMLAVDTAKVLLERIPFGSAIKGKSATVEGFKEFLSKVPQSQKAAVGKEIAKKIGVVGLNIAEESAQEGAQYAMDYFNREYGTKADKGFNFDEMYKGMIAGGSAGGFTGTVGASKDAVVGTSNIIEDKIAANKAVKTVKQTAKDAANKFTNVNKEDITNSAASLKEVVKNTVDGVKAQYSGTVSGGAANIVTNHESRQANPDKAENATRTGEEYTDEKATPEVQANIDASAANFDANYDQVTSVLSGWLQAAKEQTDADAKEGVATEFGPEIASELFNAIEQLEVDIKDIRNTKVAPNKTNYMQDRVAELRAVASAATQDEMTKIMASDTVSPTSKASLVLGSSYASLNEDGSVDVAADVANIEAALALEVTAVQRKALEFKKQLLEEYSGNTELDRVAREKYFGDGKKGLFNYASEMANGEITPQGIENLNKFNESQLSKAEKYRQAINDWDTTWAKNNPDIKVNPDGKAGDMASYRGGAKITVDGKEYQVNALADVLKKVDLEQETINDLMGITAATKTSQKGSESTQETRTPVDDTTTPVKEEKSPEAAMDTKPAPRKTKDEEDFEKGAEVLEKKIEAAKNRAKKVDPDPVVENETADIDIAALQEEFRESSPLEKKSPEEPVKDTKTTIDVVGLNAELASIQEDISYLEEAKESETLAEKEITDAEIAKLAKKAATIFDKLGLVDTVGDIILSNPAPKRKKSDLIKGEKEVALSDFFEVKKVYNNLVHKLFTKPFEEVQKIIGFSSDEAAYVTGGQYLTRTTAAYIRKFIKNGFDQSGISDIDVTDSNKEPYQSISRLLLTGEPGNYKVPSEVVGAMSVAINDWIVGYSSLRASVRTAEDTDRIFGSKNKEDRAKVSNVDGLVTTVANSLGAKIYKELGLKVKKEDDTNREVLEAKMKLELGLMAMEAMKYNNLIEINTVKAADIFSKDSLGVDPDINVFTMTGAAKMLDNPKVSKNLSISSRYAGKLLGGGTQMRYPSTTKPITDRKVKNSSDIGKYYKAAKETEEAVNKQEQTTWEWTKEYVESYMDMVKDPEGRDRLKVLLGWKEPKEHHILLQPGINGKNQAIESDMQFLEDWYNEMQATGKEQMWFPYKLVKNGRFILDSNTFNPQGKKLHRFAVHSNVATITDKTKDNHSLSLAMAFGVDIDKKTKASAIKEWEVIDNELNNLIDEGFTDLEILETAIDKGWTHDVPHTLGGIIEYRRYNEYVKKNETVKGFKSTLPIETDAVTSGFILKLLQMPILKDVKKFLAKGGVFLESDGTESFGKQAEEPGFDDAYNTPAKVMKEAMKPITKKLKETVSSTHAKAITRASELALGVGKNEAITDIQRKFMKSPFMTFNYGAGVSTIITSIGDDAIESLYAKLTSDNKKDVAQAMDIIANSRVGMKSKDGVWIASDKVAPLEDLRTMPKADRLTYILPKATEDNIRSNISASVGVALEETFKSEYAPFIEAAETINKSFVVMFRLFKHKVDKEINTKQDTLGRYLTTDEITEVYTKHAKAMPAIRTALGTEASKMMIFSTQATNYTPTDKIKESGQGKVRLVGKDNYLSGQAKFYEMVEADKAGAVIPIHYIDGSIQSIVLNEFDVLGVHDANMFYADNVIEGTRKYNEGTARTATEYSLTEEILKSIDETIANSDKEAVDAVNASLKEEFKGDKDLAPSVQIVQQDMQVLKDKSTKGREEIFSTNIRFEHAAYEGSHYDIKGKPAIITESKTVVNQSQAAINKAKEEIERCKSS